VSDFDGEIESVRKDLRELDEAHSQTRARLTEATSRHWALMDRVATGLGRIAALEELAARIEEKIDRLLERAT
jgi:chromosome segregation ATPase